MSGEGFKCPWSPLIEMHMEVKVEKLFNP